MADDRCDSWQGRKHFGNEAIGGSIHLKPKATLAKASMEFHSTNGTSSINSIVKAGVLPEV